MSEHVPSAILLHTSVETADIEVHQEADAVSLRPVVTIAIVSIAVGALGIFFAGLILVASAGALRSNLAGPEGPRPAPRALSHIEQTQILQARTGIDLRDAQRRELETGGWIDRDAGIARIPIDRAIDIIVERSSR